MIQLTIDNQNFFINSINYYTSGLSTLATLTIVGLSSLESTFLNKTVLISINNSIFLKSFTITSIYIDDINDKIILFGKDESYDY